MIHNVFHVSLLRPFIQGDARGELGDLPSAFFGDRPVVYLVRVLEKRLLWQEGRPREHVLVRWSDGTDSPTWEPLDVVQRRFPNVLLEDKDVAMERGVDTIPPREEPPRPVATEVRGKIDEAWSAVVVQEASIAKPKPKRVAKPPNKFGDFVSM